MAYQQKSSSKEGCEATDSQQANMNSNLMTSLEQERLERIRRNQEMLQQFQVCFTLPQP